MSLPHSVLIHYTCVSHSSWFMEQVTTLKRLQKTTAVDGEDKAQMTLANDLKVLLKLYAENPNCYIGMCSVSHVSLPSTRGPPGLLCRVCYRMDNGTAFWAALYELPPTDKV
eukprot:COSAG02_NODE_1961_length_10255_cov_5.103771_7_plen_112_part_00